MLEIMTGLVILIVAYSYFREGVLTALTTLVNVFIAGLVAFNFYEPLAESLQNSFTGGMLNDFEDAVSLFVLFTGTLAALRYITNNLASGEIELNALAQQIGATALGALTGYLVAGFLLCMLQTIPWSQNFLSFSAQVQDPPVPIRALLPPDRVWLGLMHRAGLGPFKQEDSSTFDPEGTFELRHERLRRIRESQEGAKPPPPQ
jgi:uncharacterized membrane protein required for colicin V production